MMEEDFKEEDDGDGQIMDNELFDKEESEG